MISEAILIPKICARLQKIASNFSNFSGGDPQTPRWRSHLGVRFEALPPYRPPFQNSWIRPCIVQILFKPNYFHYHDVIYVQLLNILFIPHNTNNNLFFLLGKEQQYSDPMSF